MSQNGNEQDNIITLTDGNGNDMYFEFLDLIEYQGKEYVVLLPADETAEEVVILEVEKTEQKEEVYCSVDDEDILMKVFGIFKEKFKDEFDFEGC